jgi:hypothetical protein
MDKKDAFDLWWEWAEKPLDRTLTIDAAIHDAARLIGFLIACSLSGTHF